MPATCPLPADDLLDTFPLAAFLDSLGDLDIRPTLHDYDRISQVLSAGGCWDVARLRHVLTALLAQNPDQQEAVQRRFDAFFEQSLTVADTATVDVAHALAELRQLREQPASPPEPGRSEPRLHRIIPRRTAGVARRYSWKDWWLLLVYLGIMISMVVWIRSKVIGFPILTWPTPPTASPSSSTPWIRANCGLPV